MKQMQIIGCLSDIFANLETGKHINLTLCDLSKVFDSVSRKLLIKNLKIFDK